jgi:hypothetical protein
MVPKVGYRRRSGPWSRFLGHPGTEHWPNPPGRQNGLQRLSRQIQVTGHSSLKRATTSSLVASP